MNVLHLSNYRNVLRAQQAQIIEIKVTIHHRKSQYKANENYQYIISLAMNMHSSALSESRIMTK